MRSFYIQDLYDYANAGHEHSTCMLCVCSACMYVMCVERMHVMCVHRMRVECRVRQRSMENRYRSLSTCRWASMTMTIRGPIAIVSIAGRVPSIAHRSTHVDIKWVSHLYLRSRACHVHEGRRGRHVGKTQGETWSGWSTRPGRTKLNKIFTKSTFLPSDFAKYVRNTRCICRAWGIFFFDTYKMRDTENKNLRRNRLWRAAV